MPRQMDLLTLINSTTYPPVPSHEELQSIRQDVVERRKSSGERLKALDKSTFDRMVQKRKDQKRKEKEMQDIYTRQQEGMAQAHAAQVQLKAEQEAAAAAIAAADTRRAKAGPSGSRRDKEREREREREREEDAVKVKRERMTVSPAPSNISATSGKPPGASQPTTYTLQHKKKKQKRIQDSDDEAQNRGTPTSPPHATHSNLKVRLPGQGPAHAKSRPSSSLPFTGADEQPLPVPPASNLDWTLPTPVSRPLVPPRPGVQRPPKPGPKKQSEVAEDYSNVKAPNQIGLPTFWNSVEPYLREIREDDLAMLGFKATAPEAMDIPARGRHYTDVWDDEDGNPLGTTPRVSVPNLRQYTGDAPGPGASTNGNASRSAASTLPPPWAASDMPDAAMIEELRGLGNISERLVAAIIPDAAAEVEAHLKEVHGKYGEEFDLAPGDGLAVKINARELEERVKKELRGVMLLGEHDEYDPAKRDDDEITSSLRQCQRLLEAQISLNEQRKSRLVSQAKNRLAFAEYQTRLDGVEKSIEAAWAKRVKKHGLKNKATADKHGNVIPRPPVPDQLRALVETRRKWLYGTEAKGVEGQEGYEPAQPGIGQLFKQLPLGQVRGLPAKSIYEGLGGEGEDEREEEEVQGVLGGEMEA